MLRRDRVIEDRETERGSKVETVFGFSAQLMDDSLK